MVIDSSAVIALLGNEPEALAIARAIAHDSTRMIAACSALETSIVLASKYGDDAVRDMDLLFFRAEIAIVPFARDHYVLAYEGWRRFGKGRHEAALNFGDCCSYGLSLATGEPLLFKGNDFSKTDVRVAAY